MQSHFHAILRFYADQYHGKRDSNPLGDNDECLRLCLLRQKMEETGRSGKGHLTWEPSGRHTTHYAKGGVAKYFIDESLAVRHTCGTSFYTRTNALGPTLLRPPLDCLSYAVHTLLGLYCEDII